MFSKASFWIFLALAVIVGLSIGLFLGWVVWPVQWVDASPDLLRIEFQEDWMNMAIDSYTVNQNIPLADQRYNSLGAAAPEILADIQEAPVWVSPAEVDAFTAAVTGEESAAAPGAEATAVPAETTQSTKLGWYVAFLILLALAAIVLLIMLVMRLLRHSHAQQPVAEPAQAVDVTGEELAVAAPVEAAVAEELVSEPEAVTEEEGGSERLAGLAAAAVVAEVVASDAGEADTTETEVIAAEVEEPQVQFEDQAPEAAVIVEQAIEGETEPGETEDRAGVGLAGLAATAATAAVIAAEAGKPDEAEDSEIPAAVVAGEVALSEISEAEAAVPVEPVVETEAAPDVETGGVAPAALGAVGLAAGLEWALEDEEEQEATSVEASQGDLAVAPGSDQELAEELPLMETSAEAPAEATPAAVDWLPEAEVAEAKLVEPEEPPKDFWGKYNRKIVEVEGIGPAYTEKLTAYGITTTQGYLQQCATPRGRQELAAKTGISSKFILEWANHIDLMRIQGIGPQWAELLEASDVNTVREMALRNPKNLLKTMTELK